MDLLGVAAYAVLGAPRLSLTLSLDSKLRKTMLVFTSYNHEKSQHWIEEQSSSLQTILNIRFR